MSMEGPIYAPDYQLSIADAKHLKARRDHISPMKFKNHEWQHNPSTCNYTCERDVAKHRYPELMGAELEGFSPDSAIIAGEGEFFGDTAYDNWRRLLAVYNEGDGIGEFFHPLFKDVKYASFKKLSASLEPRKNYVAYTFEFWQHIPTTWNLATQSPPLKPDEKVVTNEDGKTGFACLIKSGCRGSMVKTAQQKLIGHGYKLPRFGVDGIVGSETSGAIRKFQSANKLQVDGIIGEKTSAKLGITFKQCSPCVRTGKGQASTTGGKTHTVQRGDTLAKIASKNGMDWKKLANDNNITDPKKLQIGTKLKILK